MQLKETLCRIATVKKKNRNQPMDIVYETILLKSANLNFVSQISNEQYFDPLKVNFSFYIWLVDSTIGFRKQCQKPFESVCDEGTYISWKISKENVLKCSSDGSIPILGNRIGIKNWPLNVNSFVPVPRWRHDDCDCDLFYTCN